MTAEQRMNIIPKVFIGGAVLIVVGVVSGLFWLGRLVYRMASLSGYMG